MNTSPVIGGLSAGGAAGGGDGARNPEVPARCLRSGQPVEFASWEVAAAVFGVGSMIGSAIRRFFEERPPGTVVRVRQVG